jgi:hypothetical protein
MKPSISHRSAHGTGLDFLAAEGVEGFLSEDFAGDPDGPAEIAPVFLVAHVVEADYRGVLRIAERKVTAPRDGERIGPTWAWKPCIGAAALPS